MGNYVRGKTAPRRSVAQTLAEAEHDHYLDCPNADAVLRSAALLLDIILCSLAWTGIDNIFAALITYAINFPLTDAPESIYAMHGLIRTNLEYFSWVFKLASFYFYFYWSVARFGGTPAKLLLGMRVIHSVTGQSPSFFQVLVREGVIKPLSMLFVLPLIYPLLNNDRRALHDIVAKTTVKKTKGGP